MTRRIRPTRTGLPPLDLPSSGPVLLLVSFLLLSPMAGCISAPDPSGNATVAPVVPWPPTAGPGGAAAQSTGSLQPANADDLLGPVSLPFRYHDANLSDPWYAIRVSFVPGPESGNLTLNGKFASLGTIRDGQPAAYPAFERLLPVTIGLLRYAEGQWAMPYASLSAKITGNCHLYWYDLRTPLANAHGSNEETDPCAPHPSTPGGGITFTYNYAIGNLAAGSGQNDFYIVISAPGAYTRPFWLNITGAVQPTVAFLSGGLSDLRLWSHMEFDGETAGWATANERHFTGFQTSAAYGVNLTQSVTTTNFTLLYAYDYFCRGITRHHYVDPFGHETSMLMALGLRQTFGGNATLLDLAAFGGGGQWSFHLDEYAQQSEVGHHCEAFLYVMDIPLPLPDPNAGDGSITVV